MDAVDSDTRGRESASMRPSPDLREKRIVADSPWLRSLRWSAAMVGLLVPVVVWPHLGWAHLLFSPMWAAWALGLATVVQLLIGRQHTVRVDARRRVAVDGEPVVEWAHDPRLTGGLMLADGEVASFVHERPVAHMAVESPVLERRAALDRETWVVEWLRFDQGIHAVGWLWLVWSVLAVVAPLPAERAFLAPVVAFFGSLALGFGVLVLALVREWIRVDHTRHVLVLTPTELRVDGQAVSLAGARFQVIERDGFATLTVTDGDNAVCVARHRPGPIRLLASELRAHTTEQVPGEVPPELEAMRGRPDRDSAQ